MSLLLDTHVLIWLAENSPELSKAARTAIAESSEEVFCSVACIWELAIKLSLGKLKMSVGLEGPFERMLEDNGFQLLPVEYRHAARVAELPFYHRDPFDRLLIAQAIIERLTLVSHNQQFDAYPIQRLW